MNSAFLVAPPRCGSSRLLKQMEQMHGFGDCAADVIVTDASELRGESVLHALVEALGYQDVTGDAAGKISRAIEASEQQGIQNIWLVDGCTSVAASVARELAATHANLKVVIGTTPDEFGKRVVDYGRCGMRIDLEPLTLENTIEYLRHGVEHAGCPNPLFTDSSAIRLHELTGGRIADLAPMAESSLAVAASHHLHEVTPAVVEASREQMTVAA